ncbi:unnamed protein product, partial [Amoebophrya sp. A25]
DAKIGRPSDTFALSLVAPLPAVRVTGLRGASRNVDDVRAVEAFLEQELGNFDKNASTVFHETLTQKYGVLTRSTSASFNRTSPDVVHGRLSYGTEANKTYAGVTIGDDTVTQPLPPPNQDSDSKRYDIRFVQASGTLRTRDLTTYTDEALVTLLHDALTQSTVLQRHSLSKDKSQVLFDTIEPKFDDVNGFTFARHFVFIVQLRKFTSLEIGNLIADLQGSKLAAEIDGVMATASAGGANSTGPGILLAEVSQASLASMTEATVQLVHDQVTGCYDYVLTGKEDNCQMKVHPYKQGTKTEELLVAGLKSIMDINIGPALVYYDIIHYHGILFPEKHRQKWYHVPADTGSSTQAVLALLKFAIPFSSPAVEKAFARADLSTGAGSTTESSFLINYIESGFRGFVNAFSDGDIHPNTKARYNAIGNFPTEAPILTQIVQQKSWSFVRAQFSADDLLFSQHEADGFATIMPTTMAPLVQKAVHSAVGALAPAYASYYSSFIHPADLMVAFPLTGNKDADFAGGKPANVSTSFIVSIPVCSYHSDNTGTYGKSNSADVENSMAIAVRALMVGRGLTTEGDYFLDIVANRLAYMRDTIYHLQRPALANPAKKSGGAKTDPSRLSRLSFVKSELEIEVTSGNSAVTDATAVTAALVSALTVSAALADESITPPTDRTLSVVYRGEVAGNALASKFDVIMQALDTKVSAQRTSLLAVHVSKDTTLSTSTATAARTHLDANGANTARVEFISRSELQSQLAIQVEFKHDGAPYADTAELVPIIQQAMTLALRDATQADALSGMVSVVLVDGTAQRGEPQFTLSVPLEGPAYDWFFNSAPSGFAYFASERLVPAFADSSLEASKRRVVTSVKASAVSEHRNRGFVQAEFSLDLYSNAGKHILPPNPVMARLTLQAALNSAVETLAKQQSGSLSTFVIDPFSLIGLQLDAPYPSVDPVPESVRLTGQLTIPLDDRLSQVGALQFMLAENAKAMSDKFEERMTLFGFNATFAASYRRSTAAISAVQTRMETGASSYVVVQSGALEVDAEEFDFSTRKQVAGAGTANQRDLEEAVEELTREALFDSLTAPFVAGREFDGPVQPHLRSLMQRGAFNARHIGASAVLSTKTATNGKVAVNGITGGPENTFRVTFLVPVQAPFVMEASRLLGLLSDSDGLTSASWLTAALQAKAQSLGRRYSLSKSRSLYGVNIVAVRPWKAAAEIVNHFYAKFSLASAFSGTHPTKSLLDEFFERDSSSINATAKLNWLRESFQYALATQVGKAMGFLPAQFDEGAKRSTVLSPFGSSATGSGFLSTTQDPFAYARDGARFEATSLWEPAFVPVFTTQMETDRAEAAAAAFAGSGTGAKIVFEVLLPVAHTEFAPAGLENVTTIASAMQRDLETALSRTSAASEEFSIAKLQSWTHAGHIEGPELAAEVSVAAATPAQLRVPLQLAGHYAAQQVAQLQNVPGYLSQTLAALQVVPSVVSQGSQKWHFRVYLPPLGNGTAVQTESSTDFVTRLVTQLRQLGVTMVGDVDAVAKVHGQTYRQIYPSKGAGKVYGDLRHPRGARLDYGETRLRVAYFRLHGTFRVRVPDVSSYFVTDSVTESGLSKQVSDTFAASKLKTLVRSAMTDAATSMADWTSAATLGSEKLEEILSTVDVATNLKFANVARISRTYLETPTKFKSGSSSNEREQVVEFDALWFVKEVSLKQLAAVRLLFSQASFRGTLKSKLIEQAGAASHHPELIFPKQEALLVHTVRQLSHTEFSANVAVGPKSAFACKSFWDSDGRLKASEWDGWNAKNVPAWWNPKKKEWEFADPSMTKERFDKEMIEAHIQSGGVRKCSLDYIAETCLREKKGDQPFMYKGHYYTSFFRKMFPHTREPFFFLGGGPFPFKDENGNMHSRDDFEMNATFAGRGTYHLRFGNCAPPECSRIDNGADDSHEYGFSMWSANRPKFAAIESFVRPTAKDDDGTTWWNAWDTPHKLRWNAMRMAYYENGAFEDGMYAVEPPWFPTTDTEGNPFPRPPSYEFLRDETKNNKDISKYAFTPLFDRDFAQRKKTDYFYFDDTLGEETLLKFRLRNAASNGQNNLLPVMVVHELGYEWHSDPPRCNEGYRKKESTIRARKDILKTKLLSAVAKGTFEAAGVEIVADAQVPAAPALEQAAFADVGLATEDLTSLLELSMDWVEGEAAEKLDWLQMSASFALPVASDMLSAAVEAIPTGIDGAAPLVTPRRRKFESIVNAELEQLRQDDADVLGRTSMLQLATGNTGSAVQHRFYQTGMHFEDFTGVASGINATFWGYYDTIDEVVERSVAAVLQSEAPPVLPFRLNQGDISLSPVVPNFGAMRSGMSLVLPLSSLKAIPSGPVAQTNAGDAQGLAVKLAKAFAGAAAPRMRNIGRAISRNAVEIPWKVDQSDTPYSLVNAAADGASARNQISFVSGRFSVAFVDSARFSLTDNADSTFYTIEAGLGPLSAANTTGNEFLEDVSRAASEAIMDRLRLSRPAHQVPKDVPVVAYWTSGVSAVEILATCFDSDFEESGAT